MIFSLFSNSGKQIELAHYLPQGITKILIPCDPDGSDCTVHDKALAHYARLHGIALAYVPAQKNTAPARLCRDESVVAACDTVMVMTAKPNSRINRVIQACNLYNKTKMICLLDE